jgi:Cu2+-exporting ATPase
MMNEHHNHTRAPHEDHPAAEHSHSEHSHHDHTRAPHEDHPAAEHSHSEHSHHDPDVFRRLFWVCLILTVPTLVFSIGLQDILGLPGPRFPGGEFIPAGFGLAVFLIGGRVFLTGSWAELRRRSPGMMTLISLALLVAFGYSVAVTFGFSGMDFWWELATLVTIMLLGHWIEMRAVSGARDALGELARLLPDQAELLHQDHIMSVPLARLQLGDLVMVRPGAAVPADGEVVDGESELDESMLTGESTPVQAAVGAAVVAGSINREGALTVRVTKLGDDTALAGISRLVAEAQASKSGAQLLADRAAAILFYVALGAAALTLIAWLLLRPDDPSFVLERVVTVLVIACPHALGLAIPMVASISTSLGARRGILVRDRAALEEARLLDVVLFDKTGTLTEGKQSLSRLVAVPDTPEAENESLGLAAAVEAPSEHPIARALMIAAQERKIKTGKVTGFTALTGRGVTATVAGREFTVASPRLTAERGIRLDAALVSATRESLSAGATVVYLLDGSQALAMFEFADTVRPESAEATAELRRRGIRVAMLTGDSHEVAARIAEKLGIDEVFAEVLPSEKADVVARLQQEGAHRVAMVGDGVNDAPALARADVGIAIGAGTDVAIESAGIVLASSDPRGVADTVTLSRAGYRKMLQNLGWATGYNVVAIPLAAGVLVGAGILMPLALGALLMSVSTIVVALNAQLLRRIRFRRRSAEWAILAP